MLGGTAAWYRRRFAERNCRVGSSDVVHGVRLVPWLGGVEVPAPACDVGIGGWDLSALEPVTAPITCRRCQRMRPDRAITGDGPNTAPRQLPLPGLSGQQPSLPALGTVSGAWPPAARPSRWYTLLPNGELYEVNS